MMVASGQKKARGQSANGRQDCYRSQIHRLQADVEELLRKQLALDLQRQKLLGMEQVSMSWRTSNILRATPIDIFLIEDSCSC